VIQARGKTYLQNWRNRRGRIVNECNSDVTPVTERPEHRLLILRMDLVNEQLAVCGVIHLVGNGPL
jgi:hypothetical protein